MTEFMRMVEFFQVNAVMYRDRTVFYRRDHGGSIAQHAFGTCIDIIGFVQDHFEDPAVPPGQSGEFEDRISLDRDDELEFADK